MALNILERANKVEEFMVTKDTLAGEDIIYCYTSNTQPTIEELTRAHVTYGEEDKEKGTRIADVNIFYSVKLTKEPRRKDFIKYNEREYVVDSFRKTNKYSTMWDIIIQRNAVPKRERND